eukprot:CAMPEP_0179285956 /NCGR_PEP_ID=MMETSP0797-20121207/39484_1 /TAXON_ID=47934 /ORGANISM="Dinophysis acuminata, Strain DAEP01" /LENGTH=205 /DNA_ID=CAMNT_0020994807 /DNA_START=157 /DNA_END=771 /DNA_ORIENTATION=-
MIGRQPIFFSGWGVNAQLFYLGFSMAGIPIIVGAFLAVRHHIEVTFRLYLYYLCVSFATNVWGLVYFVFVQDPCSAASFYGWISFEFGGAFLCGLFRTAIAVLFTTIVTMEVYCIWVVWSYSEDMSAGRTGPEMSELIADDTGFGSGLTLKENRGGGGYAGGGTYGTYKGAGLVESAHPIEGGAGVLPPLGLRDDQHRRGAHDRV